MEEEKRGEKILKWLDKIDKSLSHKIVTMNNTWLVSICLYVPSMLFRPYSYPILVFMFAYTLPKLQFIM